jgi:hypothetical protein
MTADWKKIFANPVRREEHSFLRRAIAVIARMILPKKVLI